jgi:prolyl-tRNA synthetase
LREKNIRARVDLSENRAPDKMWAAVKKGIPLRVEMGMRELASNSLTYVVRDLGRDSKQTVTIDEFLAKVQKELDDLHSRLFEKSKNFTAQNTFDLSSVGEISEFYKSGRVGFVKVPVAILSDDKYEAVRKEYSLSSRCLPYEDQGRKVLIGKSY